MHTIQLRGLVTVGGLLLMLLTAGCFQSAGDSLQVTSVAQGVATFTPIPPPSDTPDVVAIEVTATETPEPDAILPSDTAIPFVTDTPAVDTATPESVGSVLGQGDTQAQAIEDADLTATVIIGRTTAEAALALTQTAEALATQVIPTLPPPIVTATPITGGNDGIVVQPPVFAPGFDCIHEVQPTDRNLWRISLLYGVTVHEIAAASGIANIQLIYIGQKLTIPGCGTTGHIPPPTTIPGGNPGPGPGSGQVYIVRQGDNLFRISLQYGVSVASLAAYNGIPNPNLIYIDQRIAIP